MTNTTETAAARRTKRRYAHELYPHAEEREIRPLATEVPHLYARMVGLDVSGTSWIDMREGDALKLSMERTLSLLDARRIALLGDALLQGLTGDEAWAWADQRSWDETGEIAYERARHYGVEPDRIKPYPCGPEPDHHYHHAEPDAQGWRVATRVDGKESDCVDCTEPVEQPSEEPADG